jgi:hypothetical protein
MKQSADNKKPTLDDFDWDIICNNLEEYGFCPAAIRKAEEAKKFLEENPFPFELFEAMEAQNDKK